MTTQPTDDQIRELCTICTRDDAGRHFTEWADWRPLEELGLISISRPVHDATGIPYDQQYWSVQITDEGQALVDNNPELHPL